MARFCVCGAIVERGPCTSCDKDAYTNNSHARGYGADWRKARERKLCDQPLCVDCEHEGKVTPAEEVHHDKTIAERPDLRLDQDNLVPLCKRHHDKRHGV